MFVDLDTNEVMVPFKAKSGGHRLAVGVPYAGGGALLPHPAPTGQLPRGRPSPPPPPQPAGPVTRLRARSPARPRLLVANGRGQSLRGEPGALAAPCGPAGAGAPGGEGLPAGARSRPPHAPSPRCLPSAPGSSAPGAQLGLAAPSQEAKGSRHSGQTVAPSGPSRGWGAPRPGVRALDLYTRPRPRPHRRSGL